MVWFHIISIAILSYTYKYLSRRAPQNTSVLLESLLSHAMCLVTENINEQVHKYIHTTVGNSVLSKLLTNIHFEEY
jgi:hypothetical protein